MYLPEKKILSQQIWTDDITPLVSISCITYNHVHFIKFALDGFLMQVVDFAVEILIHDDCSTDGTQNVLKDYERKFPHIFKIIYQKENQYSKGVRAISYTFNLKRVKGKYIAMCEGDDYWSDALKLQKQVDFLEVNEDYCLSNTDCDLYHQNDNCFEYKINTNTRNKNGYAEFDCDISAEEILDHKYIIRTATTLFRSEVLIEYLESNLFGKLNGKILMGDTPMWTFFCTRGKIHYLNYSTAVYRRSDGTASNSIDLTKKLRFILSCSEMILFFLQEGAFDFSKDFKQRQERIYNTNLFNYLCFNNEYEIMFLEEVTKSNFSRIEKIKKHSLYCFFNRITIEMRYFAVSCKGYIKKCFK